MITSSYQHLDSEALVSLLETHRRNLTYLEQQAAKFGSLHIPVSINNQIQDELRKIDGISTELKGRSIDSTSSGATMLVMEVRQHIHAAEIHRRVGNLKSAFKAYSRAIDLMPTADLFLARAQICHSLGDRDSSLKDLANAITIGGPEELIKEARLERIIIISDYSTSYMSNIWGEDISWLKSHSVGRELGEVFFLEAKHIQGDHLWEDKYNNLIIELLDEAIRLGCDRAEAFHFRAECHYWNANYGLALSDVSKSIEMLDENDKMLDELIQFKAFLVAQFNRYSNTELYQMLEEYNNLEDSIKKKSKNAWSLADLIDSRLLYWCAFDYMFKKTHLKREDIVFYRDLAKLLVKYGKRLPKDHILAVQAVTELINEEDP